MKKISIITAIHNQLAYNKLFFESLKKNTYYPFELIIIDNSSTDGSTEFFKNNKAKVIETRENICYSCAQNLGLKYVKTPYVAFLNNDIYLSKNWDKKLIYYLEKYNLDIIGPSGIENMETKRQTKKYMRKWRRINVIQRFLTHFNFSYNEKFLKFLIYLMYGNWDKFIDKREKEFGNFLYTGIMGNSVITRKEVFDKIGLWNKYVTGPDFDLMLRSVKNHLTKGEVRVPMLAADVFVHHFIRATARKKMKDTSNPHPYTCRHKLIPIEEYYKKDEVNKYMQSPEVSLIIAVYEKPVFLQIIFEGLKNQSIKNFEIVVADDGSGKEIKRVIKQYSKYFKFPIQHIWHQDKGFRKTIIINKAVRSARGNYLIFIDGDCIPHHRFIESHYRNRKINNFLSGRRVMLDKFLTEKIRIEDIQNKKIERLSYWIKNCDKKTIKHGFFIKYSSIIENLFRKSYGLLGCNFSLYKGRFYQVNGYNESIIGRGMEDIELGIRFAKKGLIGRTVTREAVLYHQFHNFDPVPHTEKQIKKFLNPESFWTKKGIIKK